MEDLSQEKMACKQLDEDTCPSVCFCTVNQEAININLKSNGHVHCPCEVCTGEPVYPTTAWRHLQRSKKAKFSNNEVQDEVDCCFTAEPVNIESRTGESVDSCEQITAYACGFYSEDTPDEFCNFAENVNDVDEMNSIGSDGSSSYSEFNGMDNWEEIDTTGPDDDVYDHDVDNGNDEEGDDVDKFIFNAILRAVEMKDQMAISIQNFEDLLDWGKKLYSRNNNRVDEANTIWPSKWDEVCSLLETIGYSTPKLYWVCLDSSHPCQYGLLQNKEECCPYCGKHGNIPYYYLSIISKVKRWCSSSSMCTKMTSHWQQRAHWLPPDKKIGRGQGLKKEFWDGKRFAELSYFWNEDEEWILPVKCPQLDCKTVISAEVITSSPKLAGSVNECEIECHECFHTFIYKIQTTRGDPRNIAYDG